jgi:hypothetical protein
MGPGSSAAVPSCPVCRGRASRAVRRGGRVRCRCLTRNCPVEEFTEARSSRPGERDRRDPAPPGGPELPWGDPH